MICRAAIIVCLSIAAASAAGCASSRALDQSVADIGSNAELKSVLFADRSHDYSDVDITMYEGRLMLSGGMRTEEGRRRLIENAWKANGVKQVIDEIFVGDKTPFAQGVEDGRIDAALRAKFINDGVVKSGRIKTSVSAGVVYLLGVAPDQASLDRAVDIARSMSGVKAVVSHILVAGETAS
ncbi:MAG: BON domain-containing protein [Parvularculaceae bacterium]